MRGLISVCRSCWDVQPPILPVVVGTLRAFMSRTMPRSDAPPAIALHAAAISAASSATDGDAVLPSRSRGMPPWCWPGGVLDAGRFRRSDLCSLSKRAIPMCRAFMWPGRSIDHQVPPSRLGLGAVLFARVDVAFEL